LFQNRYLGENDLKKALLLLVLLLVIANMPILIKTYAQTTPIIKVEPETNVYSPYAVWPNTVNKTFEINVTVNDVTSEQKLVAAQFYLTYNKTLLEFVSVTEGPFFQDPRWNLYDTFFLSYAEELTDGTPVVKVGVVISPDQTNYSKTYDDWTIFPNGSGVIATITFRSIYQPVEPQPSESCILGLNETLLLRWVTGTEYNYTSHDVESGMFEVLPLQLPRTPIDISIDVGTSYSQGEVADFSILTSDYGKAVNATSIRAYLYSNGTLYANLTHGIERVATGLYRIRYTVPSNAEEGTYTLLVEADFFEAKGTNIKSFLISSALQQLDAKLIDLQGTVATINSTLGVIKTDIKTLNATITSINGNIATISTTLGDVNVKLSDVQSVATTTLYVTSILSAIAVILAAVILIFLREK